MKKFKKNIYLLIGCLSILLLTGTVYALSLVKITNATLLDSDYSWTFKFINGKTTVTSSGMTNKEEDFKEDDGNVLQNVEAVKLTSDSQKGNVWIKYSNVGTYNHEIIDLKITLMDWSYLQPANTSLKYYPTILFGKTRIYVNLSSTPAIDKPTFLLQFYKHNTNDLINVKGHITFYDMDGGSNGNHEFLIPQSNLTDFFVTNDTHISISGSKIINNTSEGTSNTDKKGWVTTFFNGNSFKFQYSRLKDEKGNSFRDITTTANSKGFLGFGFYSQAVAPFEFTNLQKEVSKSLVNIDDLNLTYTLKQYIPGDDGTFHYTNYEIVDNIPDCLKIDNVEVIDDTDTNRTSWFDIDKSNNNLRISALSSTLSNENFYNTNYSYIITVSLKENYKESEWAEAKEKLIKNKAKVTISSPTLSSTRTEQIDSNEVTTEVNVNVSTKVEGEGGTIEGDEVVSYGGDSTEGKIKIQANFGYYIGKITINGQVFYEGEDFSVISKTLDQFLEMNENKHIVVKFRDIFYNITTEVNGEGGTIEGDEVVFYKGNSTKNFIKIKSHEGYYISKITINGNITYQGTNRNYTDTILDQFVQVDENKNIVVEFAPITYNVTTEVNGEGGTIEGDEVVSYGGDSTEDNIHIESKEGYYISKIEVNGDTVYTNSDSTITSYILENFKEMYDDKEVVVTFTRIPLQVTTRVNGEGGTIEGDEVVLYGDNSTEGKIKIEAEEGYYISKVTINGKEHLINTDATLKSLIVDNFLQIKQSQEVVVEFSKIPLKVGTKVNGEGGTIEGDEVVLYGDNSTKNNLKLKANKGYIIKSVIIDGEEIEIEEGLTELVLDNFENMQENHLIEVNFERISLKVTTEVNGEGGTIEGDEVVLYGDNSTEGKIKIEAEEGYYVSKIEVNGDVIYTNSDSTITSYILENFKEMYDDKEVIVEFSKIPAPVEIIPIENTGEESNLIFSSLSILIALFILIFVLMVKKNERRKIAKNNQ